MHMAGPQEVAIFWDYGWCWNSSQVLSHLTSKTPLENCQLGSGSSGYEVVNSIRGLAHNFGPIKQFKAYLELSDQAPPKSLTLRSELQSSGVSLTDCPHNGRKDVADKMILGRR